MSVAVLVLAVHAYDRMRQRLSRTMAISSVLAGPQTPGASSSCFIRDMVSSKVSRVRANEGRAAGLLKRTCPGSPPLPAPWPPLVHPCGFHAACCADKQQVIPEQNEMKHHQNQKTARQSGRGTGAVGLGVSWAVAKSSAARSLWGLGSLQKA